MFVRKRSRQCFEAPSDNPEVPVGPTWQDQAPSIVRGNRELYLGAIFATYLDCEPLDRELQDLRKQYLARALEQRVNILHASTLCEIPFRQAKSGYLCSLGELLPATFDFYLDQFVSSELPQYLEQLTGANELVLSAYTYIDLHVRHSVLDLQQKIVEAAWYQLWSAASGWTTLTAGHISINRARQTDTTVL